ncbi:thioredoxin-like protein [Dyadobacter jejuensis]|uniref:Thioredoxin-like protein n=1 Tax=Dyadobacter jejuensis TaxID=1082580 RepID=A0A316ASR0_9BACT|nr:thioredoxin family protein [Dyadobacter jejuensis]PWJ59860.1 thioredoxin-like protein [Dyadobacter jejuensis]
MNFQKMRGVMTLLCACMISFSVLAEKKTDKDGTETENGIVFEKGDWASILKKAKASKKIIFFDAYTTWCGPCKLLQKNVFTRKDVAEVFNKDFINVKFDMESGEGLMLAEKYPLQGYPTLMFIDPDGKVVKEVLGYQKAEYLIKVAKQVQKEETPSL